MIDSQSCPGCGPAQQEEEEDPICREPIVDKEWVEMTKRKYEKKI